MNVNYHLKRYEKENKKKIDYNGSIFYLLKYKR